MRRGDHAYVATLRGAAANTLVNAFLKYSQQLDLHGWVHVADFVEENRAAFGEFETTLAGVQRSGECASLVTEQFALQQFTGYGAAVNRNEGSLTACRSIVNRARHDFFAGT